MVTADLIPVCQFIEQAKLPLAYTLSEDNCVDIMAQNISKWGGLTELMTLLKISADRVIAAGDVIFTVRNMHMAAEAVPVSSRFSFCSSFMARSPAGVAAQPRPRKFAAKFAAMYLRAL